MQVSVENTGTLARRMTVALPSDDIDAAVDERLRKLGKTARLNGFRPGKIPFKVVRKRFEPQVRSEVLGGMINRSLQDAIRQENLRLAGQPRIEAVDEGDGAGIAPVEASEGGATVAAGGEPGAGGEPDAGDAPGFSFTATFEVYPEFEAVYGPDIAVARPVVEIEDGDVDEMIESLREQRTEFEAVERAAADGDRVIIDFTGSIDGEEFEGGTAQKTPLVLGSGSMIPGFESQLLGSNADERRTLEVDFPEDYQAEHLAGRKASFDVLVHAVEAPALPELDEPFVKSFGIEDGQLESLREDIRKNMARELKQRVDGMVKNQVMEGLVASNPIEVPEALVADENRRQREQLAQRFPEGMDISMLPDELFRDQSVKRVRLGLVVGEIIQREQIGAEASAVRAEIERIASSYQDPQEVIDHYYGDAELLRNVEGLVLEEAVTAHVLAAATVTDEPKTFKQIMNPEPPPEPAPESDAESSDDVQSGTEPDAESDSQSGSVQDETAGADAAVTADHESTNESSPQA